MTGSRIGIFAFLCEESLKKEKFSGGKGFIPRVILICQSRSVTMITTKRESFPTADCICVQRMNFVI